MRMVRNSHVALAGLALLAWVAGACGGGSDGAEPTASVTAVASATPATQAQFQPAYIGDAGDVWGVYGGYDDRMNLTQNSPIRCPLPRGLYWSPNGVWLACIGEGSEEQLTLVIVDAAGNPRVAMEPKARQESFALESFSWSPTGRDYAYVLALLDGSRVAYVQPIVPSGAGEHPPATLEGVGEVFWSPDGSQLAYSRGPAATLTLYDLDSRKESIIGDGLRPLAWVLGGKALLTAADNYDIPGLFATYSASLLDLATNESKPVPQLDNDAQFWLSPDGHSLAFYRRDSISFLDLSTGAVSPIPNAIPNLREWIPPDHVAFSPDGSQLFWADLPIAAEEPHPSVIYRADVDGGGMKKIGEIESVEIRFSPDRTKVLYNGAGTEGDRALWVANIDGSEAHLVAEGAWPAAWRPLALDK